MTIGRTKTRNASLARRPVVLTPAQAAELVQSGDTILINGSGGGVGTPERFLEALADRYRQSGRPAAITAVHPVGCGDWGEKGMSRLALPGLLKRQVTGRSATRLRRWRWPQPKRSRRTPFRKAFCLSFVEKSPPVGLA